MIYYTNDMATGQQKQKVKYKFGSSEIDLDNYIHNLGTNIQSYLGSKNWGEDQKREFMNSYNIILAGLQDQLVNNTNRFSSDDFGVITDATGAISNQDQDYAPVNSDYYYNNRGEKITTDDYNLLKDRKKKDYQAFPANREVASYLNIIGNALRNSSPTKEKASNNKFDLSKHGFLPTWTTQQNPSGGNFDLAPYIQMDQMGEDGKRQTYKRAQYLKEQLNNYLNNLPSYNYDESSFKDEPTYRQRLQEAINGLENGYNHEDTIALNRAGLGNEFLKNFFSTGEETEKKSELAKRAEESQKALEQRLEDDKNMAIIKDEEEDRYRRERDAYFSNYLAQNPFRGEAPKQAVPLSYSMDTLDKVFKKNGVNMEDEESVLNAVKNWINFPRLSEFIRGKKIIKEDGQDVTKRHIANNLDFAAQYNLLTDKLGDTGYYVVPGSENYDNWSYIAYNPNTRQYQELSMLQNEKLSDELNEQLREKMAYAEYDRRNRNVPRHQLGGGIERIRERQEKAQKEAEKKEHIDEKARETGKTREQIEAAERKPMEEGFSTIDKVRLGTAAADAAAAAAAFIPGYGTVASGALGIGSTLTNIGADIADKSMSGWDVAGNALYGLGMDVVGLIPGLGTTGKAAKIVRVLKPVSKLAMRALQAYGMIHSANAFNKLMSNPSDMSADDWRNLVTGLQAISGEARYKGGKRAVNRATAQRNVADVKTSTGRVATISKEDLDRLRKTQGLKAQNQLFSELTGGQQLQKEFKSNKINWKKPWKSQLISDGPIVSQRTELSLLPEDNSLDARLFKKIYGKSNQTKNRVRNPSTKKGLNINKLRYWYRTPKQQRLKGYGRDFGIGDIRNKRERQLGIEFDKLGGTLNLQKIKKYQSGNALFYDWNAQKPQGATWAELVPSLSFGISSDKGVGKVSKGEGYTFDTTSRLNSILNRINSGKMTIDDANQMQTRHWGMYTGWNPNLGPIKNDNVARYQQDYQSLGLNDEVIAPNYNLNYNIESSIPTSGDSKNKGWTIDGLYSQITDDRRILARAGDYKDNPEQLKLDVEVAKKAGYDYYLDPSTQYYMLRKIQSNNPISTETETHSNKSMLEPVTIKSQNDTDRKRFNFWSLDPTLLYGIPRAFYADRMNRKITDLAKKSVVPLLKDPFEVHRAVRSDLDAEMQGQRDYADLRRLASKPITSDGNLQTATQLQAESQGQKARIAGKEKSNQVQRQYSELAWQQEKENAANRHETGMFNRAQLWNADKTKNAFEQAYLSKKHNIWDTLMQQMEFEAKQKKNEIKALSDNFARQDIHNAISYAPNDYGANLTLDELTVWNKVLSGTNPSSLSSQEFNSYKLAAQKVSRVETEQLRQYYKVPNTKWSGIGEIPSKPWSPTTSKAISAKNGAKIAVAGIEAKTADAERFQKQIKECIDRNEKAIDRLSKSLYGLIKSSMIK